MNDAFGRPQNVLLLGGSSDIGRSILREVAGSVRQLVLAGRDPAMAESSDLGLSREVERQFVAFEATDPGSVVAAVDEAVELLQDLDLVILAYGMLGDQERARRDPAHTSEIAVVNYVSAVAGLARLAEHVRAQGHGTVVVLSSVAGERVRPANYHYGASKAALDAFCQGLASDLRGTGGRLLVVRPGFVETKMTAGMDAAPFSTTPEAVARAVVDALGDDRRVIWVPSVLRWVMTVLRHLPAKVVDRLPR